MPSDVLLEEEGRYVVQLDQAARLVRGPKPKATTRRAQTDDFFERFVSHGRDS
jgi:hypothetical protein